MSFSQQQPCEVTLTWEPVNQQLQKMFRHPVFESSDILKRFLSFVVEETLHGHSNQLKEYTIAVKILNKPSNFNPQENGIVRIHAGRLRRALEQYYDQSGMYDPIRISIPKGNYVPIFSENTVKVKNGENRKSAEKYEPSVAPSIIAVIPFRHLAGDTFKTSLAEGLGLQLSNALISLEHFSVVGYYAMRKFSEKFSDVKSIGNAIEAEYLVTGDIQSHGGIVRIFIQMIQANSGKLIWSQMFEKRLGKADIYDIQDEIVQQAVSAIETSFNNKRKKLSPVTLVAVA